MMYWSHTTNMNSIDCAEMEAMFYGNLPDENSGDPYAPFEGIRELAVHFLRKVRSYLHECVIAAAEGEGVLYSQYV